MELVELHVVLLVLLVLEFQSDLVLLVMLMPELLVVMLELLVVLVLELLVTLVELLVVDVLLLEVLEVLMLLLDVVLELLVEVVLEVLVELLVLLVMLLDVVDELDLLLLVELLVEELVRLDVVPVVVLELLELLVPRNSNWHHPFEQRLVDVVVVTDVPRLPNGTSKGAKARPLVTVAHLNVMPYLISQARNDPPSDRMGSAFWLNCLPREAPRAWLPRLRLSTSP